MEENGEISLKMFAVICLKFVGQMILKLILGPENMKFFIFHKFPLRCTVVAKFEPVGLSLCHSCFKTCILVHSKEKLVLFN